MAVVLHHESEDPEGMEGWVGLGQVDAPAI